MMVGFLKLNGTIANEVTLRAAGDDILVLSSNSETAEDVKNTASVVRALVSV